MKNNTLIIGSRGSDLALWQSQWVKQQLTLHHADLTIEIQIVKTKGDNILDVALSKIGGKGLFTKALEDRLLDGSIDLAVHSLKDLPTVLPAGLAIAAVTEREDPGDVFVARDGQHLEDLPEGSAIATGSLRRQSQLLNYRPDLHIHDLRGNVPTRLSKLEESDWKGIVLAKAGLKRLELLYRATQDISRDIMLPAVGQGALGIETRQKDFQVHAICAPLNHADSQAATTAERAFLRRLEGGCQVPVGAFGQVVDGEVQLRGYVGTLDGSRAVRGQLIGSPDDAGSLGIQLANQLIDQGAETILTEVREALETDE